MSRDLSRRSGKREGRGGGRFNIRRKRCPMEGLDSFPPSFVCGERTLGADVKDGDGKGQRFEPGERSLWHATH